MASPTGGQYTFSNNLGENTNVVVTTDGAPPTVAPIDGQFNLDVQIIDSTYSGNPNELQTPDGFQGLALLEDNGNQLVLLHGNIGVTDNGPDPTDTIIGGDGNDTISGGTASSVLIKGGSGFDTLYGGSGFDTIIGGSGPDTIAGGSGPDLIIGGSGPDAILGGSGSETIIGGKGADFIVGGSGAEAIMGGFGANTIVGGTGPDTITGGSGPNTIYGGSGGDTIQGGPGSNLIYAGPGKDLITDNGTPISDTVSGFDQPHGDRISFAGENPHTIKEVLASAKVSGGNTTITLPDGSTITLLGITHINAGYFH